MIICIAVGITDQYFSYNCFVVGITDQYFAEISQDTGRFCFGVDDTLAALESGAIDVLIVWENLDITRYSMLNHQEKSMYKQHL
jgi:peptide chain release factor subunit 1